jgi:hypothetical protein
MNTKRKVTYEQSQALEYGHSVMRANRRRRAAQAEQTPQLTTEQNAKWEAEKAAALAKYRAKKAAQ